MKEIVFKLGLFGNEAERAASERVLTKALELLLTANVEYLRLHPETPGIYQAGVRYKREPLRNQEWLRIRVPLPGGGERIAIFPRPPEEWKTAPYCIDDRFADCEDLACWLAAQRIVRNGINARPTFTFRNYGNVSVYHIIVQYPDGTTEDPSRKLGMA